MSRFQAKLVSEGCTDTRTDKHEFIGTFPTKAGGPKTSVLGNIKLFTGKFIELVSLAANLRSNKCIKAVSLREKSFWICMYRKPVHKFLLTDELSMNKLTKHMPWNFSDGYLIKEKNYQEFLKPAGKA